MPRFERNNSQSRGNNGKNSSSSSSVRLMQFYPDATNDCGTTLSLTLWKKYVIFSLAYALPENERTDNNVYDYDNPIQVMVSPMQILALRKGYENIKKNEKIHNVVVFCKDDYALEISDGQDYGLDNYCVAIVDVADTDASKRDAFTFKFNIPNEQTNDLMIYYNFDPTTVTSKTKAINSMELDLMMEVLDQALYGMTGAASSGAVSYLSNMYNRIMSSLDVMKGMMESIFSNKGRSYQSSDNGNSQRASRPSVRGTVISNRSAAPSPSKNGRTTRKPSLDDEDDKEATIVEESSIDDIKDLLGDDDEE